jgi:hypothetical protein
MVRFCSIAKFAPIGKVSIPIKKMKAMKNQQLFLIWDPIAKQTTSVLAQISLCCSQLNPNLNLVRKDVAIKLNLRNCMI